MMKSVIETIKANKGTIVKRGLTAAAVIGGTILIGALVGGSDDDELDFAEEFEDEEVETEEVPSEEE